MDEAVWVKQALKKNQPGKPVRVINPDDESIRIFHGLLIISLIYNILNFNY
ncbi:type III secretion apparatus protein EprH [Escherichia coli DEC12D]|nr:type III secretion apparatus protein EprH [Escherichia coli DEC12D]